MAKDAFHRRAAEVDKRMAASSATGAARAAERRRVEADVEAEEISQAQAAAAQAEASSERQRIAAVVKAGRDTDRSRQALRLALSGPVSAAQAAAILATLPKDADAPEAALGLPGRLAFGAAAAQEERARIASILGHPDAQGRFRSACAFALEGDEVIPADAALAMLSSLPLEALRRTPGPGQRAEGLAEMGGDYSAAESKGERIASVWSKAISEANGEIGAGPAMTAPVTGRSVIGADDPAFGMTVQGRAAIEAARAAMEG